MNRENASAFEAATAFYIYAGGPAPNEAHSTEYSNMSFCNTTACCGSRESSRRIISFVFVYDPSDTIVSCCSSLYLVFSSHVLQVLFYGSTSIFHLDFMADLRLLSTAPEDTQYSTLEVDHKRWLENDGNAAPIVGQDPKGEKIFSYNDVGKQVTSVDEKIVSYDDVGKQAVHVDAYNAQSEPSRPAEGRKIFGLTRKTFFILLAVVLVLIIAAAVGGGVIGTRAARNREYTAAVPTNTPSPTPPQAPTTTQALYANTGLAAMQWTDLNGTLHKRLYYQDNNDKIRESAWDNSTAFDTAWVTNIISDAVKPGTPIAAAAGYPHASYSYSLVRIAHVSFTAIG
jgi:hypothetical protein